MDAWGLLSRLVRRWYVFLPVLLVAVVVVVVRTDPGSGNSYEVQGTFLVAPSPGSEAINQYVSTVGPQLVATRVAGAEERARFEQAGYNSEYTVANDRGSSFISVTVIDQSETRALETAAALEEQMRATLVAAQDELGVSRDVQAQLRVVDPPTYAEETSAAVRVYAVPLVIAGVFAVLATLLADQILMIVRSRRQGPAHSSTHSATADPGQGSDPGSELRESLSDSRPAHPDGSRRAASTADPMAKPDDDWAMRG